MILDFSVIRQKHALTCPGLYRLIFKSLYHTSLILPLRWAIDETVNFRNFRKLFKREKRNEVAGHMNYAAMAVTCTLAQLM